jgi:hypothetical protein
VTAANLPTIHGRLQPRRRVLRIVLRRLAASATPRLVRRLHVGGFNGCGSCGACEAAIRAAVAEADWCNNTMVWGVLTSCCGGGEAHFPVLVTSDPVIEASTTAGIPPDAQPCSAAAASGPISKPVDGSTLAGGAIHSTA